MQDDDNKRSDDRRIDLVDLFKMAQALLGNTLQPLMEGRAESVAIMKKHVLRSEAELLRGLLALVEDEEKRVDQPVKKKSEPPSRKVPVE